MDDASLRLWLLGLLHRQRERGGLHHPYLNAYARQGFWGKYPHGKLIQGRETYPAAGRYKPRLWTTHPDKHQDHLLAPPREGQLRAWPLVWTRRALGVPGLDDATLLDLLAAFLHAGEAGGLLRRLHQDGDKTWYAIDAAAARLLPHGEKLRCDRATGLCCTDLSRNASAVTATTRSPRPRWPGCEG
ncbi:hypothetical protein [Halochromatium glycolicum]|uniref:hypothetical protein n=1 Tax=Halochromatium glycolicum TaxID=85075 RepID=UPI00190CDF7D|nr:hypothetical protein [Halochromatium glycolicum]